MWEQFRAIAGRLGLRQEEVERVERSGTPTWVQHPLDSMVHIQVLSDPDWTFRMGDAWRGNLVNSRQEVAGTISIADGRLHVFDPDKPEHGITAIVVAGEYEVVLTIAHLSDESSGDHEEHVSHAYVLLCGTDAVALIEPMTADDETEIFLEAVTMAFSGTGALDQFAAEHAGGWVRSMGALLMRRGLASAPAEQHWARVVTNDGLGALVAMKAGSGRGEYPLFKIADSDGNTTGVLVDFYVDNRPY